MIRSLIVMTVPPTVQIRMFPGPLGSAYNAELAGLMQGCFASRLFAQDQSLFGDAEGRPAVVARRLGWVSGPEWLNEHRSEWVNFAGEIRRDGFEHILLLGMGGSSLCPEVLSLCFPRPDYLRSFEIVDTTDPVAIRRLEAGKDLSRTLFIVSSKSGSTVETQSQTHYFFEHVSAVMDHPGEHFVAITDSGSSLERYAEEHAFRHVFLNPEDIGGRYSALSCFGMLPAALLELPLDLLAKGAELIHESVRHDLDSNVVLNVGALLGACARAGIDKLTFVASPALAPVVPWIEQLVAESTGKSGFGIIPIDAESPEKLSAYGADRIFCVLRLKADEMPVNGLHADLISSDRPWLEFECSEMGSLAGLFLLWEYITVAAGRVVDVNPLDEPNVKESKDNTLRILNSLQKARNFEVPPAKVSTQHFDLAFESLSGMDVDCVLSTLIHGVGETDYLTFLYFGDRTVSAEAQLGSLRQDAREATGAATLRGYGPRYLHSIGQLYKGGTPSGHFVIFHSESGKDLNIPGMPHTFGQLLYAQALGDYQALTGRKRPCLWVKLKGEPVIALGAFSDHFRGVCSRVSVRS